MSANGGGAPHTAHRGSAPHPCIHAFIHSGIQRYRYNIEIKRVPLAGVSHTAIQATHSHYTTKISTRTNQPIDSKLSRSAFTRTHTHTHVVPFGVTALAAQTAQHVQGLPWVQCGAPMHLSHNAVIIPCYTLNNSNRSILKK